MTDLGAGYAYGVNAGGQVVGQNAVGHAFFFSNGITTDLGTLGGDYSFALGINDSGQVVGWAQSAGGATHGFLFGNGTMTNLSPGSLTGGAQGINSIGQVVGWASEFGTAPSGAALGPTNPYKYDNGVTTGLGSFPANSVSYPLSINDSGQVVGYTYQIGVTGQQPFLIENGATTILGVSGAFQKNNASGQIVGGQYLSDTVWRGLIYDNGIMSNLGTLGGSTSWAYGINDGGQIVGTAATSSGTDHAFLYTNGMMTDLNSLIDPSSGWVLKTASAINDNGQIVGWGEKDGETRAFLLNTVPEPASVVIWGGIALAGAIARWRRMILRR